MRDRQNTSAMINANLARKFWDIRLWSTWEDVSLIFLLDGKLQASLRETFKINWKDLDIHVRLIDECVGTGVARDQRIRRDMNVKIVYELTKVPEGIHVLIYMIAITQGVEKPLFDDNGYPRKLVFERLFPEELIQAFFFEARAFRKGMEAYSLALRAQREGNEQAYDELAGALQRGWDVLDSVKRGPLTVSIEEEVEHKVADRKQDRKGGKKKPKIGAAKPQDSTEEPVVDPTDETAQRLTAALGLDTEDPNPGETAEDEASFAEVLTPVPVASASPTPAPKPKKEKPVRAPQVKLGLKDLGSMKDKLPPGPSDGSNGQS